MISLTVINEPKMKSHSLLLFLFIFVFSTVSSAQTWTVFNTGNSGIPDNSVYDLAVDTSNILWVATAGGLAKFDGNNWLVYNSINSPISPSSNDDIYAVYVDWEQNVWVGTDGGYLYKFDQDSTWIDFSAVGFGDIFSITQDYDGKIWVGHYYGLQSLDDTTWTDYTAQLPDDFVSCVEVDTENHIWAGTKQGVAVFDNNSTWISYTPSNSPISPNNPWIESIKRGFNDDIWIGSRDGIFKFDKDTTWVKYNSTNSPLWDDTVNDIDIDSDSIVWIANDAASMGQFTSGTWTNIFFPSSISFSRSIIIDLNGYKWIGAQNGLARYNPTGSGPIYLEAYIPKSTIGLNVYPNPTSSIINIAYTLHEKGNVKLTLYQMNGVCIYSEAIGNRKPGKYIDIIELDGLSAGNYFIILSQNNNSSIKQVIVD